MPEADLYVETKISSTGAPIFAQVSYSNPVPVTLSAPTPNGNVGTPLAVTGTTGNVALPAGAAVMISNIGTVLAFTTLGVGNTTTATTGGIPIAGGTSLTLGVGTNTFLAAITSSGTTTLNTAGIG